MALSGEAIRGWLVFYGRMDNNHRPYFAVPQKIPRPNNNRQRTFYTA